MSAFSQKSERIFNESPGPSPEVNEGKDVHVRDRMISIPKRDLEDILHQLNSSSSSLTGGDSDFERFYQDVEEQVDRLSSYLPG